SIQRPVLYRLRNVLGLDVLVAFHVRDGARHLQDPVMRPGAQPLLLHGAFQHALAVAAQVAIGADLARTHLRVGIIALARGGKAVELHLARPDDALAYLRRTLALAPTPAQLLVIHRRHVDMYVDAVHQRPGNLRNVALDHRLRALALPLSRAPVPARAWVHGRGQHEARREGQ